MGWNLSDAAFGKVLSQCVESSNQKGAVIEVATLLKQKYSTGRVSATATLFHDVSAALARMADRFEQVQSALDLLEDVEQ